MANPGEGMGYVREQLGRVVGMLEGLTEQTRENDRKQDERMDAFETQLRQLKHNEAGVRQDVILLSAKQDKLHSDNLAAQEAIRQDVEKLQKPVARFANLEQRWLGGCMVLMAIGGAITTLATIIKEPWGFLWEHVIPHWWGH